VDGDIREGACAGLARAARKDCASSITGWPSRVAVTGLPVSRGVTCLRQRKTRGEMGEKGVREAGEAERATLMEASKWGFRRGGWASVRHSPLLHLLSRPKNWCGGREGVRERGTVRAIVSA